MREETLMGTTCACPDVIFQLCWLQVTNVTSSHTELGRDFNSRTPGTEQKIIAGLGRGISYHFSVRLDPDFSKQRATSLDWWFATRSLVVLAVSLKLRKVRYLLPLLHAFFRGTGDPSCSWAKSLPFLPQ